MKLTCDRLIYPREAQPSSAVKVLEAQRQGWSSIVLDSMTTYVFCFFLSLFLFPLSLSLSPCPPFPGVAQPASSVPLQQRCHHQQQWGYCPWCHQVSFLHQDRCLSLRREVCCLWSSFVVDQCLKLVSCSSTFLAFHDVNLYSLWKVNSKLRMCGLLVFCEWSKC